MLARSAGLGAALIHKGGRGHSLNHQQLRRSRAPRGAVASAEQSLRTSGPLQVGTLLVRCEQRGFACGCAGCCAHGKVRPLHKCRRGRGGGEGGCGGELGTGEDKIFRGDAGQGGAGSFKIRSLQRRMVHCEMSQLHKQPMMPAFHKIQHRSTQGALQAKVLPE